MAIKIPDQDAKRIEKVHPTGAIAWDAAFIAFSKALRSKESDAISDSYYLGRILIMATNFELESSRSFSFDRDFIEVIKVRK